MDTSDTQPVDVMELPTPGPTPIKPMSFDEKADVKRAKFQNRTNADTQSSTIKAIPELDAGTKADESFKVGWLPTNCTI